METKPASWRANRFSLSIRKMAGESYRQSSPTRQPARGTDDAGADPTSSGKRGIRTCLFFYAVEGTLDSNTEWPNEPLDMSNI